MLEIKRINNNQEFKGTTRDEFVDFLFLHLGKFGDPKKDIQKCLSYAFSDEKSEGGYALAAFYESKLVGGLIMNKTGMGDYIPDWILVYVAVDASYRGKGFGKQIIAKAFNNCEGRIKLHVEYDNPAKRLYERMGFTTKYAEMRYENNK
ncbi:MULTISPECIES: GNAT family N-acetyltransferase [unclassified Lentimicrobium]|uniref:GNAT family N-acetyltransferase n=1 Tax=unclassified Lentimicrobium TaxID=2677434 RepID=UPI0015551C7C|nr:MULTISPECIES: GNAT family N-acetyltransferase [unclassified Lentimicrobium]NPD45605.1 GNAT family N-acetyltransferase [Lentimicrobium sp. S6]NPD86324.1 GNAT family N-acetyltransferase [Lentimicrobium sp. L6]